MWREDDRLAVSCYSPRYTPVVDCSCPEYEVTHGEEAPEVVKYFSGRFKRLEREQSWDFLAPVYVDEVKQLYLFSHHPEGRVWQVSQKLTTTPLRGVFYLATSFIPRIGSWDVSAVLDMWDMGLSLLDIDDLESRDVLGLILPLSLAQKVLDNCNCRQIEFA